jgi:cytochrome c5
MEPPGRPNDMDPCSKSATPLAPARWDTRAAVGLPRHFQASLGTIPEAMPARDACLDQERDQITVPP